MKRKIATIISFMFVLCMLITGCTGTTTSKTFKFKEDLKFEIPNEVGIKAASVTKGQKDKVPFQTFKLEFNNLTGDRLRIEFENERIRDTSLDIEFEYEDIISIKTDEQAEWEIKVSGEEVNSIDRLSVDMLYDTGEKKRKFELYFEGFSEESDQTYNIQVEEQKVEDEEEPDVIDMPKDEPVDEPEEEPEEPIETTTTGVWGNDLTGYIKLDETWEEYKDQTVDERVLMWRKNSVAGTNNAVVTLSAVNMGERSIDSWMTEYTSEVSPENYQAVVFGGEEGDDAEIGMAIIYYPENNFVSYGAVFKTDYSENGYYVSVDAYGHPSDEFIELANNIIFSHSELQKVQSVSMPDESDLNNFGQGDISTNDDGTFPLKDFDGELVANINIPGNFTLSTEYTSEHTLVLNTKSDSLTSLWINGYMNGILDYYIKNGKIEDGLFEVYDTVEPKMFADETLSNGSKLNIMELITKNDTDTDLTYAKSYYVAVDNGTKQASFVVYEWELKKMGYTSPKDLVYDLFGK